MNRFNAVKLSRREMVFNNFLGGIAWAMGTTLGFSLVIAVLGIVLKQIQVVPIVGEFVIQITQFVHENSTLLP